MALTSLASTWIGGGFASATQPYLVISSPHAFAESRLKGEANGPQNERNLSQRLGQVFRECGFKKFEIRMTVRDLKYVVPVEAKSDAALKCVMRSLRGAEHVESIEFKAD